MRLAKTIFILLFLVIWTANIVIAQPTASAPIFSPFDVCEHSTERADHIFYGEIKSVVEFDDNVKIDINDYYNTARFKVVVRVIKSFKESLPQEIEVYFDWRFMVNKPLTKNRYIFRTKNALKDGIPVQQIKELSKSMIGYSEKAVKDVFESTSTYINEKRQDFVEGVLLERLLQIKRRNEKNERTDRLIYDVDSNTPIIDAVIEFVSEKNGNIYRVKTKSDGSFRINKVQPGNYTVKTYVEDMKLEEPLTYPFDGTICSSKWFIYMIRNR